LVQNSALRGLITIFVAYPNGKVTISRNLIQNSAGVETVTNRAYQEIVITNNACVGTAAKVGLFEGVQACIRVAGQYGGGPALTISGNSFLQPGRVGLEAGNDASGPIDARNNWWGATDLSVIRAMIVDHNSNLSLPATVSYLPFLSAPDPLTPRP
jgi:hypothetical protein